MIKDTAKNIKQNKSTRVPTSYIQINTHRKSEQEIKQEVYRYIHTEINKQIEKDILKLIKYKGIDSGEYIENIKAIYRHEERNILEQFYKQIEGLKSVKKSR